MASIQVVNRQKSAESVSAAAEANAETVQEVLAELVKPHLKKGEKTPDFASLMLLSAAALGAAKDRMVQKDGAHEAELGDDVSVREAREEARVALYDQLVGLREMIIGVYGSPAASKILPGAAPEDAVVLSRFAGEVAENLGKAKLPAPRVKGAKLDVAEIAESLREKREELDRQLKAVQRELREAQKSLHDKNAAIAAYDDLFTGVANTVSGLLRLAGKPDLAAKVRPSARRPGQTAADAGDADEPETPPET